jgi:hypothetical protein
LTPPNAVISLMTAYSLTGAAAHVVVQRTAADRQARCAVGHQPFALRRTHLLAQVGLARAAELALAALGGVKRNHVVAGHERGHAGADLDDDAGPLVAEHHREQDLGVVAREREGIGVAHAGVRDLHQHLAGARRGDVDFDDFKRFAGSEGDGGSGFHGVTPVITCCADTARPPRTARS